MNNCGEKTMECYHYSRNIQDLSADGKNSARKRMRHSISWTNNTLWSRDISSYNLHKRQKQASSIQLKKSSKVFFGNTLNAGGGWTRDLLVADAEEMKDNSASEVYVKRF